MGCRFHLGQAWFRAIQKFGLPTKYKGPEEDEAGKWMRYLFGLPYLNPEEVGALQPTDNRITQLYLGQPTDIVIKRPLVPAYFK
jgi:hypothetical protein